MKPVAFALGLLLLALPVAARADENLVVKRETCRQEARARIGGNDKVELEEYRRIVERRSAYVSQCMTRVVVAPLPPHRVQQAAAGEPLQAQAAPAGRKSPKHLKRKERRKVQAAFLKGSKGQGARKRKLRRPVGRNK